MAVNRYLQKLAERLFSDSEERARFLSAFESPNEQNDRALIWTKERPATLPYPILPPLPFQPDFVDRIGEEPWGKHQLHAEGYYYICDLSSIFCSSVLNTIELENPLILDLCSAPGGKGIYAWRRFAPEFIIFNETVKTRVGMLRSNVRRCGVTTGGITSSDPSFFAAETPSAFDLVIVDAPCSGQSILLKGEKNPGAFHPVNVKRNAQRQKRILGNAGAAVAPGGYLLYMTCTFSPEENGDVVDWFLKKVPGFQVVSPGEQLYPQQGFGVGGFRALLRRNEGSREALDQSKLFLC